MTPTITVFSHVLNLVSRKPRQGLSSFQLQNLVERKINVNKVKGVMSRVGEPQQSGSCGGLLLNTQT